MNKQEKQTDENSYTQTTVWRLPEEEGWGAVEGKEVNVCWRQKV